MADYTPNEIVDILLILGEARHNYSNAVQLFRQRFPRRRCPTRRTIRHLEQRARRGVVKRRRQSLNRVDVNNRDPRTITVLGVIHNNPHVSLRAIQRDIGISRSTAQRIVKAAKYHPYHVILVQEISEDDYVNRLVFCNWALQKIEDDIFFFHRVLFSDEATFHNVGIVNRHNSHYWSPHNPHWIGQV